MAQFSEYTITNTGETDLVIGSIFVKPITENSDQIFTASLGSYFLAPGEFTNVLLQANCNIEGIFQAEVEVSFVNSSPELPCLDAAIYNVSVDIQDEITEVVEGVVTINFYLGGTLIDQQFADLWDRVRGPSRLIKIESYSQFKTPTLVTGPRLSWRSRLNSTIL